jgi:hypothetical protein
MKKTLFLALMVFAGIAQAECMIPKYMVMTAESGISGAKEWRQAMVKRLNECRGTNTEGVSDEKIDSAIAIHQKIINAQEAEEAKQYAEMKARDAVQAKQQAAWKAEAARLAALPGVRIGMSADAVLTKSSWGKPASVNRTTTAYGTREQWVYGGNYLYFTNGILTAIQN